MLTFNYHQHITTFLSTAIAASYGNVGGHNDLVGCGDDAGVGSDT